MINTIFHFVNDPTFDYTAAVNNGDVSEYTIVFNSADHGIYAKNTMFGRMSRADIAQSLGDISDILPAATDSKLGAIKIGYQSDTDSNSRRYGVRLDQNNRAYVEVPWTDTITPAFDNSELVQLINTQRDRIDSFINNMTQSIEEKTQQLFQDRDWILSMYGEITDPDTMAGIIRQDLEQQLEQFDVWEWVDPNDHSKGKKSSIDELRTDQGLLEHRVGTAEETQQGISTTVSTLSHSVEGLSSTVSTISSSVNTLSENQSSLTQTAQSISGRVTSVEGNIDTITGNVTDVTTRTANLELAATGLTSRVTLVETGLSNKLSVSEFLQTADSISTRIGSVEDDVTTKTSAITQRVDGIDTRVGVVETTAANTSTAMTTLSQRVDGINSAVTQLSSSLSDYDESGDVAKLVQLTASVLDLKTSKNGNTISSVSDLASVIQNEQFTGYSGLSDRVVAAEDGIAGHADLLVSVQNQIDDLDIQGAIDDTIATSGFATESWVGQNYDTKGSADDAEKNAKDAIGPAITDATPSIIASAKSSMVAAINNKTAGINVLVEKDSNGYIESGVTISADNIRLEGTTFAQTIKAGLVETSTLTAGTANINVASIDSATINSANITGTLNGVNGVFSGQLSAATGSFSGIVNATQFKAGDDNGFSITTSSDSLDFNYEGLRLAFFSLRGWDETNGQLAEVSSNPTGFYLYLTNPLNGHLITIDFTNLSFKDLNYNQVLRHPATFYRISNSGGRLSETQVTLYYSLEDNTTKWWAASDATTELTSAQMGTLYKKRGYAELGYHACVQLTAADTPYIATPFTLYEEYTLQNDVPTKTGNYAMTTNMNSNGSLASDNWYVLPDHQQYLDSLNTDWGILNRPASVGIYDINRINAVVVVRSGTGYTVPTFTDSFSAFSGIDANGDPQAILYPDPV